MQLLVELAAVQGRQLAAPGVVPRPVEGQQARLDADVLDVDGVAERDMVLAGVLEGNPLLGGIEDQRLVAVADCVRVSRSAPAGEPTLRRRPGQ
jgi:hypothetical protein